MKKKAYTRLTFILLPLKRSSRLLTKSQTIETYTTDNHSRRIQRIIPDPIQ